MKKLSLFVAGLSVLAGLAVQAANTNVTSVNIVGYIKVDLPSNQLVFAAENMSSVGGGNVPFTTIGDQMPVASWVYFWNAPSQTWDRVQRTAKSGWGVATNRTLSVGQGVFLKAPTNVSVNLLGEVPLAPTSTVTLLNGYNAIGCMYPTDIAWTNTALSQKLPVASWFNVWDQAGQSWVRVQRTAKSGWGPATNTVLKAGQAFFIQVSSGTNVVEPRPFTP
jgi:hypothetical protein